jgi:hypothetical protein
LCTFEQNHIYKMSLFTGYNSCFHFTGETIEPPKRTTIHSFIVSYCVSGRCLRFQNCLPNSEQDATCFVPAQVGLVPREQPPWARLFPVCPVCPSPICAISAPLFLWSTNSHPHAHPPFLVLPHNLCFSVSGYAVRAVDPLACNSSFSHLAKYLMCLAGLQQYSTLTTCERLPPRDDTGEFFPFTMFSGTPKIDFRHRGSSWVIPSFT